MAREPKPPPHVLTNFGLTKEDSAEVAKMTRDIVKLEATRSSINADINANRKRIKSFGIDLTAWAASKARFHMDPEQRTEFDRSREICDKALGVPVQSDLFAGPMVGNEDGGEAEGDGLPTVN